MFQKAFASCWNSFKICNETWTQAVDYLEICGIIVGQILVGILGDWYVLLCLRRYSLLTDLGLGDDGVLSKMPLLCSLGFSCSLRLGALRKTGGSSATCGRFSFTASA